MDELVLMEFLARQDPLAQMAPPVLLELMEKTAQLGPRGLWVQLALLVQMEHQEQMARQVHKAQLDQLVQMVLQVHKDQPDEMVKMQLSTQLNQISEPFLAISDLVIKI
jgi:hypothetical protein